MVGGLSLASSPIADRIFSTPTSNSFSLHLASESALCRNKANFTSEQLQQTGKLVRPPDQ